MKNLTLLAAFLLFAATTSYGQVIVSDDCNVTGSGTGFALGNGVNSGISPSPTRLAGSAASNLRYIFTATGTTKPLTAYTITSGKQQVAFSAASGRYSLSADGSTPFNFASALTSDLATPANPAVYDIGISMANNNSGTVRFSFALGTAETDANNWDFGIQLYRLASGDNFYQIGKRVDTLSSGLASDLNAAMTTTAAGTYGSELNFLMRVTDAGAETGANYNSRLQISMNGGSTWFYDTATDSSLVNGWRLDGPGRFLSWDQAGAASGTGQVTYDNFSVTLVTPAPEPSVMALSILGAIAFRFWKRR